MTLYIIGQKNGKLWRFVDGKPIPKKENDAMNAETKEWWEKIWAKALNEAFAKITPPRVSPHSDFTDWLRKGE